jgi:hypothetical protein
LVRGCNEPCNTRCACRKGWNNAEGIDSKVSKSQALHCERNTLCFQVDRAAMLDALLEGLHFGGEINDVIHTCATNTTLNTND